MSNETSVNSNFIQTSSTILDDREFYSTNLTADKFFEKLSSNFKLKLSLSESRIQNRVNQSELRNIKTTTLNYGGEYRSVFTGMINFHFGTSWNKTIINTLNRDNNLNNTSFMDVNLQLNKKLLFSLKNARYFFGNLSTNRSFWFSDFEALYNIKKNKYKLTLQANNIFNTDSFSNFIISDTGFFSNNYRLLPRYLLLKFEFRF